MINANPEGTLPKISPGTYVHPTAVIIGDVTIGKNVFIGPMAVLRADEKKSSIIIGDNCNVQDGVVIHSLKGTVVRIEAKTSLSHGSVVHGPCSIGKDCFIGFKTIVFKAEVSDNVFVGHNVLIENVKIPENSRIDSSVSVCSIHSPDIQTIDTPSLEFKQKVLDANQYLVKGYLKNKRDDYDKNPTALSSQ